MVGKHFGKTEQDDAQVNQHIHFMSILVLAVVHFVVYTELFSLQLRTDEVYIMQMKRFLGGQIL
jgi:hypothetical protein